MVEGYGATACFYNKSMQSGASAPVLEQVYRILYQGVDPMTAVGQLAAVTSKQKVLLK